MPNRGSRASLLFLAPLFVALLLAVPCLHFGLPSVFPLQDESLVVDAAVGTFTGDWRPPEFRYPTAFIYAARIALQPLAWWMRATGRAPDTAHLLARHIDDPTPFYLVARSLALAASLGTIGLTILLARRLAGKTAAILAGFVLALTPVALEMSVTARVDAFATLLTTAALLLAVRYGDEGRWRDAVLGAAMAGLAIGTKQSAVTLLPALAYAALRPGAVKGGLASDGSAEHRPRLREATARGAARLGLLALVVAALFLATNPFVLLDFQAVASGVAKYPKLMKEIDLPGHDPGYILYPRLLAGKSYGAGFLIATAIGLAIALRSERRRLVPVIGFVVTYLAVFLSSKTAIDRYLLPVLPLFAVFAGIGMTGAANRLRLPPLAVLAVAAAFTAVYLVPRVSFLATSSETRFRAIRFVESRAPAGSLVVDASGKTLPPFVEIDRRIIGMSGWLRQSLARHPETEQEVREAYASLSPRSSRPAYRVRRTVPAGWPEIVRSSKPQVVIVTGGTAAASLPEDLASDYSVAAEFRPSRTSWGPPLTVFLRRP